MHRWQDIVLSLGSLVLAIALIPSILSEHKPALWTSCLTGSMLALFSVVYATLSLWYACATTAITTGLWIILAVQRLMQSKS